MGETDNELTKIFNRILDKLDKVAGMETSLKHLSDDVARVERKLDEHVSKGDKESLENKGLLMSRAELHKTFAPISAVKDIEEIDKKMTWFGGVSIVTIIGIIGYLLQLLINFLMSKLPNL